jgi:hypothetical protein
VRWYDGEPVGDGHLQGQFAALKDVVGDMIDKGVFTPSTARQYLKRKLGAWVGDRQELRIPNSD